jgi:hypothetical protein
VLVWALYTLLAAWLGVLSGLLFAHVTNPSPACP